METQKGHGEGHGRKGFKSYYVVWKLEGAPRVSNISSGV